MLIWATMGGAVMVALMGFAQSAEQLVLIRTFQGLLTGIVSVTQRYGGGNGPQREAW